MERLLTIQQLSELIQVKPSTIYKWVHYQYVPFIKLGSSLRFKETKIEDWISKRERKGRKNYRIEVNDFCEKSIF